MKKYIFSLFFFLFVYNLHSQVLIALLLGDKLNTGKLEFGLDGGINFSSIGGLETKKYDNSFFLGFYFDIKMKENWLINTGVMVKSTLGADELTINDLNYLDAKIQDDGNGTYTQKINGFLVPIKAKYKFDNHMHVEAGPQLGLITKGWIEYNYEDDDGNSVQIKEDNSDNLNWFDMGVTGGVGYRFLKGLSWTISANYYYGFTNAFKGKSGTNNQSLYLKANVPFGVSDEKKKEIKRVKLLVKEKKQAKKTVRKERKQAKKAAKNN